MKLFDLDPQEEMTIKRLVYWHLGYLVLIATFFVVIFYFGFFKAHPILRDRPIFTYLPPIFTLLFILVSPWRRNWLRAIKDTYDRLEGEPAFCLMAILVFIFGFYLYSTLLWGAAALGPALFYM